MIAMLICLFVLSACQMDPEGSGDTDPNVERIGFGGEPRDVEQNEEGSSEGYFSERDGSGLFDDYSEGNRDRQNQVPNILERDERQSNNDNEESEDESEQETPGTNDPAMQGDQSVIEEVVRLTNEERQNNGLSELQLDPKLSSVAQRKSVDMADNNYFSHTSPTYGSPFDMLEQYDVSYTTAAENIAAGQQSAESVVRNWMNSEGHRANILNGNMTHIGVGYEDSGSMNPYWTQMFIAR